MLVSSETVRAKQDVSQNVRAYFAEIESKLKGEKDSL